MVYAEAVGEPVEYILLADGRVVVLAVLRAGLLFAKQLQGRMPGETLANGAASLLGLPESTPELVRHPVVFRPVVPAERFVAGAVILHPVCRAPNHTYSFSLRSPTNPVANNITHLTQKLREGQAHLNRVESWPS